jgi:hypothetical protein
MTDSQSRKLCSFSQMLLINIALVESSQCGLNSRADATANPLPTDDKGNLSFIFAFDPPLTSSIPTQLERSL